MAKLTEKEWREAIKNFMTLPAEEQKLFNLVLVSDRETSRTPEQFRKRLEKTIRYLAKGDWDAYR